MVLSKKLNIYNFKRNFHDKIGHRNKIESIQYQIFAVLISEADWLKVLEEKAY